MQDTGVNKEINAKKHEEASWQTNCTAPFKSYILILTSYGQSRDVNNVPLENHQGGGGE